MSILVHKISNVINSRGNAVGWHFNFNNWEESLGLKKKFRFEKISKENPEVDYFKCLPDLQFRGSVFGLDKAVP